jgi:hypothetical protein
MRVIVVTVALPEADGVRTIVDLRHSERCHHGLVEGPRSFEVAHGYRDMVEHVHGGW